MNLNFERYGSSAVPFSIDRDEDGEVFHRWNFTEIGYTVSTSAIVSDRDIGQSYCISVHVGDSKIADSVVFYFASCTHGTMDGRSLCSSGAAIDYLMREDPVKFMREWGRDILVKLAKDISSRGGFYYG